MDAHAHLLSLGWAGPGHSLDSRPHIPHKGRRGLAYDPSANANTGRGLVKPLLISQKKNSFGIGKKSHEPAAGNEWWLKGFEDALSNIGKGGSSATSGTATPDQINVGTTYRGKHNGLYGYFIKGQRMTGTMDEQPAQVGGKKRKSDNLDDQASKLSRSPEPSSKKKTTSKRNAKTEFEQIGQFMEVLEKDRKEPQKPVRTNDKEVFTQISSFLAAENSLPHQESSTEPGPAESKEDRRRRRKERKDRKEKEKQLLAEQSNDELSTRDDTVEDIPLRVPVPMEDDSSKAARKAERKKRKKEKRLAADMT